MSAAMWEDRGHAAKITAAAKAAGCTRSVRHGFVLSFEHEGRTVLRATFNPKGALHRSSVRSATRADYAFADTYLTPAESTRAIVGWFEAGMPSDFDVMGFLAAGWLK